MWEEEKFREKALHDGQKMQVYEQDGYLSVDLKTAGLGCYNTEMTKMAVAHVHESMWLCDQEDGECVYEMQTRCKLLMCL